MQKREDSHDDRLGTDHVILGSQDVGSFILFLNLVRVLLLQVLLPVRLLSIKNAKTTNHQIYEIYFN